MDSAHVASPVLTFALAIGAGVLAQMVGRHLRLPGIVLLLAAGVGLGPDGLHWVDPRELGSGLYYIVDLAVAVILFEGGMNLEISRLRREQTSIRRLVTWGGVITGVGGALAARWLLDWEWMRAALFGSLVVVTGPTVIGPLVRELRLRPRVSTVLEAEGVLIDPIGAIAAVLVLELVLAPSAFQSSALETGLRLGFGSVIGVAGGIALAFLLRTRRLVPEGTENITVLAAVLALFAGADAVATHSGILAATLAGVVVGNSNTRVDRDLREFKDQLTVLLIGLLFVLLAADVRYADVVGLGWPGLVVVLALILVVRPLNVLFSTLGSDLSWAERGFIAWIAPRGIVAAAVASLTAAGLEANGLAGGSELRALVFLTIAGTVLLAGVTALPMAALLGVRLPGRDLVAILGAQGLGFALGRRLRQAGRSVVFIDSNPQNCRRAEEAGFTVVFGNALQERTLARARFELVGTAIAITPNDTLNGLFVQRARELFETERGLVAVARAASGGTPELVRGMAAEPLFESPHDVERWDVRDRHGEIEIQERVFAQAPEAPPDGGAPEPPRSGERFVILALERGKRVQPMTPSLKPREGDVATVAVHIPEREAADRILRALGWEPREAAPEDACDAS